MKKKVAARAERFITQLMQIGVEQLADDIFDGTRSSLNFEALTAEDAERVFSVGEVLFRHAHNGTGYNVIVVAESILLIVIDGASGVVSSVKINGNTKY